jgi:tetratricopeptide (TPR) repeat protein
MCRLKNATFITAAIFIDSELFPILFMMNPLQNHLHTTGCKAGHRTMKKVTKKDKKGDDHFTKGNYKQAIDLWWEAMNNDMTHLHFVRPTLLKVVKAHILLGEYDKAVEEANKHVANEETVEGLHALGEAQMAGEKFDEAIRTYQRALEIAVSLYLSNIRVIVAASISNIFNLRGILHFVPFQFLENSPMTKNENASKK